MTTEAPLLHLDFDESKDLELIVNNIKPLFGVEGHSNSPLIANVPNLNQSTLTKKTSTNHLISLDEREIEPSDELLLVDDYSVIRANPSHESSLDARNSVILLTSSTSDEGEDDEEVDSRVTPDVAFENINLDCGDNREAQPLLGGRDHVDAIHNHFPGNNCFFFVFLINV